MLPAAALSWARRPSNEPKNSSTAAASSPVGLSPPSGLRFFHHTWCRAWPARWNASVVSEVAEWGQQRLTATGLGSYISHATDAGDFRRTVVGVVVMALFVVVLNRLFWRPVFAQAERKFRMS